MRIPVKPPTFQAGMDQVPADTEILKKIVGHGATDSKGRYLHWDEVRRYPPANGLTHEQTWLAMQLGRLRLWKSLPFLDKEGDIFCYGEPDNVRRALRWLDLNCAGNITTGKQTSSESELQLYSTRSILEEPIHSSILEGAASTRAQARELIEQEREPRDQSELMILNNYRAMHEISELKEHPLTPELIFHLHRVITEGTLEEPTKAGMFRDADDMVDVVDTLGEVLHHPPESSELPQRLNLLCEFANGSEEDEPYVHPIARAVILHFMLAYDHPFVDGNGRLARALFYWSVLRAGYWQMKYVSISNVIQQASAQYGKAFLKAETDQNDLTYFLDHQLVVIKTAILNLQSYTERQQQKFEAFESLLSTSHKGQFNHRQAAILKGLVRKNRLVATLGVHEKEFGISYQTARSDLEGLVSAGLLRKRKQGKQSIYYPVPGLAKKLAMVTVPTST